MPSVVGNLIHKNVGETSSGELFRMKLRDGYAVCITLLTGEGANSVIGVLKGASATKPIHLPLSRDLKCASYGVDWLLEPVWGDESFPRNRALDDAAHVLWAGPEAAVLRFYRPQADDDFDSLDADLLGSGIRNRDSDALPVRHWRIWASEADRNRPGAMPIVEFGAPDGA